MSRQPERARQLSPSPHWPRRGEGAGPGLNVSCRQCPPSGYSKESASRSSFPRLNHHHPTTLNALGTQLEIIYKLSFSGGCGAAKRRLLLTATGPGISAALSSHRPFSCPQTLLTVATRPSSLRSQREPGAEVCGGELLRGGPTQRKSPGMINSHRGPWQVPGGNLGLGGARKPGKEKTGCWGLLLVPDGPG